MAAATGRSRLQQAILGGQATAVAMNSFRPVVFSQTPCIGTDGLGSCSVILIVSRYAALLGHASPRPGNSDPDDANAGYEHVRSFMIRFTDYYKQLR